MALEEANRLYDRLLKHFTNSIIDNIGGASSSDPKLSSTFSRPSNLGNTYWIEEPNTHDIG